ncbi:MAG: hypothetical protein EG824_08310 [Deltaproteobacteria bacterium]|nr:hypothetical protein [Deltaproteobacteria bacterium]
MFDFPSIYQFLHSRPGNRSQQAALIMTGFDSVTVGNDEYILLTPPDHERGEIREYYQFPNDPKTVRELMDVIGSSSEGAQWLSHFL